MNPDEEESTSSTQVKATIQDGRGADVNRV